MGRKEDYETEYALYHGDEFIMIGNKYEIAKRENMPVKYVTWYASPTCRKRQEKQKHHNGRIIIRL